MADGAVVGAGGQQVDLLVAAGPEAAKALTYGSRKLGRERESPNSVHHKKLPELSEGGCIWVLAQRHQHQQHHEAVGWGEIELPWLPGVAFFLRCFPVRGGPVRICQCNFPEHQTTHPPAHPNCSPESSLLADYRAAGSFPPTVI